MLALISGRGSLPGKIARAQSIPPVVCVLDGFAPDGLKADVTFRLEQLGTLLAKLGHMGVTEVCLCGSIDRPVIDPAALDDATRPLVPLLQEGLAQGDDGALRAVMGLFEQTGFTVRAAHDLLPDLMSPSGVLSKSAPDAAMHRDAARGMQVLAALSPFDVGQACVVGGGQVLGVETLGGTDFMLAHLPDTALRSAAVLVKGPKTGQDRRADMPTIGPDTVDAAVEAGLGGIVIDAGQVILLEPEETVARADAAGLVLWSRSRR